MDISRIEVDPQHLNRDIRTLRTQLNQGRSHIKELKSQMDAMNRMWQGAAHEAMKQRFVSDYESLNRLCRTLEEIIAGLEQISKSYEDCEHRVHDAVQALTV